MARLHTAALALAAMVLSAGPVLAGDREDADAALSAGRHADALRLFQRVLDRDPSDLHALRWAATLSSWSRKYDAAASYLDRVAALEADPQKAEKARLDRARNLGWAKRHAEAIAAYEALLSGPSRRDAWLGIADAQMGRRDFAAARAAYQKVLEDDPRDVDALLGQARSYAWSGAVEFSRPWFDQALAAAPERPDAGVALAYVELSTDYAGGHRRLRELEGRFPGDAQVKQLGDFARRARLPAITASYARSTDDADSTFDANEAQVKLGLRSGMELTLGGTRTEMRTPGVGNGLVETIHSTLSRGAGSRRQLSLRAGFDRLEGARGQARTEAVGGAVVAFGLGGPWSGTVAATRDTIRHNVGLLDLGLTSSGLAVSIDRRVNVNWFLSGQVGAARLDATNGEANRYDASASVRGRWLLARTLPVEILYSLGLQDHTREIAGHFTPFDYVGHTFAARTFGQLSKVGFFLQAATTIQGFSSGTGAARSDTDGDVSLTTFGGVSFAVAPQVAVEVFALRSEGGVQNPAGFVTKAVGMRLRVLPGR